MFERERGDISGSKHGDFTDWDNPEDWADDEPADYDDEDGGDEEDWYVPGPDDPDYDLSEAAGYAGWEPTRSTLHVPRWALVTFSILLILAMLTPLWIRIT